MTHSDKERFSAEQRRHMVAEAAYYLAERRGFQEGGSMSDWLQAEIDIERRLDVPLTPNKTLTKRKPRTTPEKTAVKTIPETL